MSFTATRNGDSESRKQTEEFSSRKKELRAQLTETQGQLEEARLAFANGGGSASDLAELANQRDRLKSQLDEVEQGHRSLLGRLAPGGANHEFDPSAVLSEQFSDPEFQRGLERLSKSSARIQDVQLAEIDRDALVRMTGTGLQAATGGIVTPPPAGEIGPYRGIVPYPTPPTTVLDLIGAGTFDNAVLPYAQEIIETGDPGPAPAAPGTTKAAMGVGYQDVSTASTTIAGWVKVQKQSIADQGQLQGAIQSRGLIKLRQAIENAVLAADGTVSDAAGVTGVKGLLNTTGIGSVDATGITSEPDAVLDGIVNLLASGAQPNAVVLNINDWATLLKTKSSGSGEYVANPFLSTARTLWDLNFLPSVNVATGTGLILDTRLACSLLYREGANVILGQESDDLIKNMVTVLIECRVLLPVYVPAAVCEIVNLA